METSTARPQEAVERRGKGVRRAGRRMMAFVRGAARPVGQAMMVFLFTFVRWFGIPSPFAAALLLAAPRGVQAVSTNAPAASSTAKVCFSFMEIPPLSLL